MFPLSLTSSKLDKVYVYRDNEKEFATCEQYNVYADTADPITAFAKGAKMIMEEIDA